MDKLKMDKTLVRGSLILLIMFGLFNFFNFIFQLSMARMLSVAEYGALAAIFSIIYILSVFSESIQLIVTKYVSGESENSRIKNILKKSMRKTFLLSIFLFLIFLAVSIPLSYLMKIDYVLLSFSGLVIFFMVSLPITRGIMQGKKLFGSLGKNMVLESLLKLFFAVGLVFLGFGVYGAVGAVIAGSFIALVSSFKSLKKVIRAKERNSKTPEIYDYSLHVFIITLCIIAFYSLDIVIAKIVFDEQTAGYYAIASILSKTIFWGTQPVSKAMFPLAAENKIKKKTSDNVFPSSFLIVASLIFIALLAFYLFPDLIVKIFSGKQLSESSSILFYLGVATGLISLANLNFIYKLSLGKTKGFLIIIIFLILEIFLLFYFSNSLIQFSLAFIASSSALLWWSVVIK